MAKILLVEDDKSLREIYDVRLKAEGYQIVSAGDGEEALAMAIKERPDLIVSDVMMPKISGFDMLDILRSTTETKNVKVIMMTALSSDDQRARGEALGADRYLVKSQVGIEDVVRTVHDVLADNIQAAPAAPSFGPAPIATPVPAAAPLTQAPAPVLTMPAPVAEPAPQPQAAPQPAPTPVFEQPVPAAPAFTPAPAPEPPVAAPAPVPAPVAPALDPAYGIPEAPAATPQPAQAPAFEQPQPAAAPQPAAYAPEPAPQPQAAPQPVPTPVFEQPAPVFQAAPAPAPAPVTPAPVAAPAPASLPQPTAPFSTPAPASLGERIIEPLTAPVDPNAPVFDIAAQMDQALGTPAQQPIYPDQTNTPQ